MKVIYTPPRDPKPTREEQIQGQWSCDDCQTIVKFDLSDLLIIFTGYEGETRAIRIDAVCPTCMTKTRFLPLT